MPQTATLPTGGESGAGNLPTPVKLGLIGGGLGLAFFLWRKASSGGGSEEGSTFGIPNSAIMLGSLQQLILDLKGEVGSGNAELEDMISGGFENIGYQLDAQTATIQGGLGTLRDQIIDNNNTNTQSIISALNQGTDALGTLIRGNTEAINAVNASIKESSTKNLDGIAAFQNAVLAAIGVLGTNVTSGQAQTIAGLQNISGQLGGMSGQLTGVENQVSAIGNSINTAATSGIKAKNADLAGAINDKLVWSTTDNSYYYSSQGHIYQVDWWWANKHFDTNQAVSTSFSFANFVDAILKG